MENMSRGANSSDIIRVFPGEVPHIGPKEGFINGIPFKICSYPD